MKVSQFCNRNVGLERQLVWCPTAYSNRWPCHRASLLSCSDCLRK